MICVSQTYDACPEWMSPLMVCTWNYSMHLAYFRDQQPQHSLGLEQVPDEDEVKMLQTLEHCSMCILQCAIAAGMSSSVFLTLLQQQ